MVVLWISLIWRQEAIWRFFFTRRYFTFAKLNRSTVYIFAVDVSLKRQYTIRKYFLNM